MQHHPLTDPADTGSFFAGKSAVAIALFNHFIEQYKTVGDITVEATKTMIGISRNRRITWVIKLGRQFVDVVFPFSKPYPDNLCFHKIAQVPGQQQFNHHLRLLHNGDVNEEVLGFMRLAYNGE